MRLSDIATLATACTLTTGLLAAPGASAAAPDDRSASPVVRLLPDRGSPVRAAEVPVTTGSPQRTSTYSMVGLTWHGAAPELRVRARGTDGWGAWLHPEVLDDGPDGAETSRVRATQPLWVGPSDGIQVDARGTGYRDLELVLIDPGVLASDRASAATPTGTASRAVAPESERAPRPALLSRKKWGADPSWRNGSPVYNRGLRQVHVHHTATGNSYSRADVPAILRGMYRYHTKNLGWFDLGYNFVVDKFGRAWVGRSGGVSRLVRGAHTLGFNHSSVGIAVIGNFESARPTQKALTTVVRLAAWKLDRHRRDAQGRVVVTSEGSDRYAAGRSVRLFVISGHRATNETACPGELLHERLPAVRRRAQQRIDRY
ncbi:MAG: peptidoglycan recognition protein [Nocardioides sp.]